MKSHLIPHTGPYPSASHALAHQLKSPLKIANITWTNKSWASVLNYANFLYINVAGENKEDLGTIKKIVDDLDLINKNKIQFNFNKTCGRGLYRNSNEEQKTGTNEMKCILSDVFLTIDLHVLAE